MRTPVLFLIFNRPSTTRLVFEAIRRAQPERLFVGADGPRRSRASDEELCRETRSILSAVDWKCEVRTLFRDTNVGCRKAVSGAIDWFFSQVDEGIILEDDCLPDPTFFPFCEQLLEYYRHDSRVMQISGCNFQFGRQRGDGSYYFSKYNHIWGWASWKRAWQFYDVDMKSFADFEKLQYIKCVFEEPTTQEYWLEQFRSAYSGEKDTWDYQWTYAIWKNNGLTILPNVNLIRNIGFGDEATHTGGYDPVYANNPTAPLERIVHPSFVIQDIPADKFSTQTLFIRHGGRWRKLRRLYKLLTGW